MRGLPSIPVSAPSSVEEGPGLGGQGSASLSYTNFHMLVMAGEEMMASISLSVKFRSVQLFGIDDTVPRLHRFCTETRYYLFQVTLGGRNPRRSEQIFSPPVLL